MRWHKKSTLHNRITDELNCIRADGVMALVMTVVGVIDMAHAHLPSDFGSFLF